MTKYYKVLQDNFLWAKGAILTDGYSGAFSSNVYTPIDKSTIWNQIDDQNENISATVIENNPQYFAEVFPVNLITKTVYKAKEEARALIAKDYD